MDRDRSMLGDAAILCEQSAMLRDTLDELRATAKQLQIEARAVHGAAQRTRAASRVLVRLRALAVTVPI